MKSLCSQLLRDFFKPTDTFTLDLQFINSTFYDIYPTNKNSKHNEREYVFKEKNCDILNFNLNMPFSLMLQQCKF